MSRRTLSNIGAIRARAHRAGGGIITDADFASVVLLLDMDGADDATELSDLSDSAHAITFENGARLDTEVAGPFAASSLRLQGLVNHRLSIPFSTDWDFGTGDYTVEAHVRMDDGRTQVAIGTWDGAGIWWLGLNSGTGLVLTPGGASAWSRSVDTWYHIAACRSGTNLRLFVDGVQLGSTITDSTDLAGVDQLLYVGTLNASGAQDWDGYIGPIRVTKGVARYTANFTAPTQMYPTS